MWICAAKKCGSIDAERGNMRYFIIEEDRRFTDAMMGSLKVAGGAKELRFSKPVVTYADFSDGMLFSDLLIVKRLFDHFFFASERFYTLLAAYEENLSNVPFFVTSKDYQKQIVYRKLLIEGLDTKFNPYKATKDEAMELKEAMKGGHLARMSFEQQQRVVVSLHIAENALRKHCCDGIQFVPVACGEV
jgi:hypothetical protein